jgi:hypothetical protein
LQSAAEAESWSRLGLVDELFVSVDTVHYIIELRHPDRERPSASGASVASRTCVSSCWEACDEEEVEVDAIAQFVARLTVGAG